MTTDKKLLKAQKLILEAQKLISQATEKKEWNPMLNDMKSSVQRTLEQVENYNKSQN